MINVLRKSLEIEIAYSVNSFIYILSKLPILRDLITKDIYKSNIIKKIVRIFGIVFSLSRAIFLKFMYFFVIFYLSYKLFPNTMARSFYHVYFFLTILGLFINNKLLNTNKKKYFSIILFNMDATKYFRANLFFNQIYNLIFNTICILFFSSYLLSPPTHLYSVSLIVLSFFTRLIGEALNIYFYKKNNYIWYSNSTYYFTIVLSLFGACFLPLINIIIPIKLITIFTIIITALGIISLKYLLSIKDYKLIYKKLSLITNAMDSKNEKDYLKQAMVEVKDKDKKIDSKILENKKGYDLFNTIFFERHKEILLRSAKKYAVIALIVYVILIYLMFNNTEYFKTINSFMHYNLAWFVIIMFFINRGAIITQAMFFNCDHAMLRYNFYREPKVILELFKKRLITVVSVNLIPSLIIGIGNIILLILTNDYSIISLITTFLFIICLSIFFSVHYLVIYYLLQPFNKNLEVKKASYSFVTLGTYIVSYMLTDLVLNSLILSVAGILFTIAYIVISLYLVYKIAPRTFKL